MASGETLIELAEDMIDIYRNPVYVTEEGPTFEEITTYNLDTHDDWYRGVAQAIDTIEGEIENISFTELDPTVPGHVKTISTGDITNWNSKEPAIAAGTTAQYWRGDKTWQTLPSVTAAGSTGQIQFNNAGAFGADSNLFWDNTNKRIGIGTTPTQKLDITSSVNGYDGISVTNSSSGTSAVSRIRLVNNLGDSSSLELYGSGTSSLPRTTIFSSNKNFLIGVDNSVASGGTSKFQIYTGGYNNATNPQFTFDQNGRFGIGATSPASLLSVVDNAGIATPSDTSALSLLNNTAATSVQLRTAPSIVFGSKSWNTTTAASVDGRIRLNHRPINTTTATLGPGSLFIQGSTNGGSSYYDGIEFRLNAAGTNIIVGGGTSITNNTISNVAAISTAGMTVSGNGGGWARNANLTTGTTVDRTILFNSTLTVTGGTGHIYNGVHNNNSYNITGGTSTVRGFYYSPTLTNMVGATHIGFENTTGNNIFNSTSGSTGIGVIPSASAKLEVASTTQGLLPPRMSTTQKNAIVSPAAGLMVYDNTLNQMSYYNGTTWINF